MIPSERLKGIEAFVCTVDAGSFTAAAERLNLTASAVGKSVARLEARLNSRLFERSTRRLALTDAGRAFYGTCVRVLAELQDAEAVLAAQRREPSGRLRVDLPATFGRLKALPLLLRFARQYPRLRPHISFTDRFVDLVEDGIDVAVRIGGPERWAPGLGHRYLGSERVVFCASPDYLARRGEPRAASDLLRHDAVAYGRADGEAPAWRIAQEGGPVRLHPVEGAIVLDSAEAQVEAVAAGCGIAQLATWLAADALREGRVVEVLPQMATEGLPLYLAWPLRRQLSPKVDAALEMLGESLRIA
ncbi:MAG: LysR substrate-binding domain-containing protein [Achromobacter sp.]|uniref:LysR substrate-binding domain-containing protein n=1 Tax=Achromobacter sp. TaxID=134375 RepID=UPI003D080E38